MHLLTKFLHGINISSNLYLHGNTSFFCDMKITLHQLKVFECVARMGSVTQAAHELHMTQPAVSNIIRQLEEYYDCSLIEVIGRKLSLTVFGQTLVEGCQKLQTTLENTQTQIDLLKGGLTGTLHVATVSTARYFIPRLLGHFKTKYPDIHIKLVICNRHEIINRLSKNLDDFVIMSNPPRNSSVDCANFYDDELVIASSIKHKLSKSKQPIKLSSLKQEAWILREEGSGTRYATENIFRKSRFKPKVEMEISDNEAIKQAIMANIGISVISKQSIKIELSHKLISLIPTTQFPVKHTWYLVKNKGKNLAPIAESFYTFVNHHQPIFKTIY